MIIVQAFAVGGALIGLWLTVRFPNLGPQSLGRALLTLLVAMLALNAAVPVFALVVRAPGIQAALFAVLLPVLSGFFWAVGCMIRACATLTSHLR
jgi:hypothetical protein